MVESMNDGVVTDPEIVKRYLHTTLAEVGNLNGLVNNLFEMSQIDAGVLELHLEAALLQDLVSDTLESMAAPAATKKLELRGNVDDDLEPVLMDTPRVQRVLYNLVQNSIRHTPPDGSINIHAVDAGQDLRVEVVDTGEGIPERDLPRLFQRSYRVDRSRSPDPPGGPA
jgi:signal transduction histidine kinase